MAVPKQECLILFDFDDEEDDDINFTENDLSEEKSPAPDKDEDKSSSVETDEDMGLKVYNKYYQQFMDLFKQWDLDKQRCEKQRDNLIVGTNVLAIVEENPRNHIFKAIKVKAMNNLPEGSEPSKLGRRLCIKCVTSVTEDNIYISKDTFFPLCMFSGGFRPFNGDLLLVEYSMNPGTSNMNIHSASPLNSQNMEEVCVTCNDGRNGVVEATMFFTLDSLHTLPGYTPGLYDIVNTTVVDSIQSHYTRRVVSMTPVDSLY
ncbi:cancer/testis antigen 55-like [Arvicanthis niloticus]|uniref:cancer/testis antigen 55-like n=1 Tax=Arvicanthis niloticus TaxID=61156 RepID=UPI0014870E5E|nr:cancer/testis antigen 55-like [Arvicanthis niloticus]